MQQPSIYPFGFQITEPVIALTDLLIALVAFYCWRQWKKLKKQGSFYNLMNYYFILISISTFMGGVFAHALLHYYGQIQKVPGWQVGMLAVFCLELASIEQAKSHLSATLLSVFKTLAIAKLLVAMFLSISTQSFTYVGLHLAIGLFVVMLIPHLVVYRVSKDEGNKYFLMGIGFFVVVAIVFAKKISPHPFFTEQDVSHVLIAISVYLFYKGAKLILQKRQIA